MNGQKTGGQKYRCLNRQRDPTSKVPVARWGVQTVEGELTLVKFIPEIPLIFHHEVLVLTKNQHFSVALYAYFTNFGAV